MMAPSPSLAPGLPPGARILGPTETGKPIGQFVDPPAVLYVTQLPPTNQPKPGTQPRPGLPPVTSGAPTQLPPTTLPQPVPLSSVPGVELPGVSAFCPTCGAWAPEPCGPGGSAWLDAEYLLWWVNGFRVPPLVTASPVGTERVAAGVLGVPGTQTIVGDDKFNGDARSGLRVRAGLWLDDAHRWGIEGGFFFLGTNHEDLTLAAPGDSILARPFVNVGQTAPNATLIGLAGPTVGLNDAQFISFPGLVSGGAIVNGSSSLYGFEANGRRELCCDCNHRLDLIAGYRFLAMKEDLSIGETLMALGGTPAVLPGTSLLVRDHFRTENYFNGGQIGLAGEYRFGDWIIGGRGTVALGVTHEIVQIDGATLIAQPGLASTVYSGGLLTQPTNIGRTSDDKFAVVPEVGLSLGYQVLPSLRLTAGYNFLYWSNVARPGDQIDLNVNATQIPPGTLTGVARPAPTGRTTDLFVHGLTFGVELRY